MDSREQFPLDHKRSDSTDANEQRRDFLKTMAAGVAVGMGQWIAGPQALTATEASGQQAPRESVENEYNELFRRKIRRCVEVGFHYHDFGQFDDYYDEILSKFNAKDIVANLVRANADSCHIWAEAISMYYYDAKGDQLKLGHKHKSLRGRDLIAELTEEAKKHGISVLVYTSAHSSWDFARLYPELVMKDNEGNPVPPKICFNSPLLLELQKERSSYLLSTYEMEGMFFDMMNFPFLRTACYCDICRKLFQERYGLDLPTTPARNEDWEKFLQFRYDSNASFTTALKNHLRETHPGKIICFNYHGHVPFGWVAGFRPVGHSTISDAPLAEDFAFRFSQGYPSLTAAFLAGLRPGAAYQVLTDMTLGGYGDFTQRPLADLKWNLFTGKMRGANVMVIEKILHDYSVRPAVYNTIGAAFAEVKEKEGYFDHPPLKEVGLYYSLRTRDWYDQHNPDAYQRCVVGAYRALVDAHYQVEFLFDESASLQRLRQFPVIFLANNAIVTEEEARMFREYVAGGGSLLGTWETALCDARGNRQGDFILGDVFGIRYVEHVEQRFRTMFGEPDPHVEPWNFLRFAEGKWTSDVEPDLDLPVPGGALVFKGAGAQTFGELRTALPGGRPPGTAGCSPWKTVGPALAVNSFGKGKAAFFPVPLDFVYASARALPDHRNLMRNVLRHLLPNRRVSVEAPVNVETVVMQGDAQGEFIVHFVGMWPRKNSKTYLTAPAPTTELMEEAARYRATLRLQDKVRRARVLSSDSSVRWDGNIVRLETGEVHEAVIIST